MNATLRVQVVEVGTGNGTEAGAGDDHVSEFGFAARGAGRRRFVRACLDLGRGCVRSICGEPCQQV